MWHQRSTILFRRFSSLQLTFRPGRDQAVAAAVTQTCSLRGQSANGGGRGDGRGAIYLGRAADVEVLVGRLLFAPNSITVAIKAVDVLSDDSYRTHNIGRAVTATARTIDITSDRNAGARVIGVA